MLSRGIFLASRLLNSVGLCSLVVMMFLTTVDVVLRYVFRRPVTGSLELTEFMMAILVAFALAYTQVKKGHVIVEVLIGRFSPRVQATINSITCLLSIGIFAVITWRGVLYAENLRLGGHISSALYIPTYPFGYVVAFGSAVMCLVLLINLVEHLSNVVSGKSRQIWLGLSALIIVILFVFSLPAWGQGLIGRADPLATGLLGIAFLIIILFSGMTIGIVMVLVGFLGFAYTAGLGPALTNLGPTSYSVASSYSLSVIPLFVLMGAFCFYSGLSRDLYRTANKWLGRLPGGLAMATVAACAGFAAVSGSSIATVATVGTVALPEMKKYKYDPMLATGCIAAGGSMGILIPPSVVLVIYGILTEQSIGKLFVAGFIPGVLEAVFYIVTIYILCRRNPKLGPRGEKTSFTEKIVSLKDTWAVLTLFILVIGGIYAGIFTPTEAAGVGAFGAFVFALIKRQLGWKQFTGSLSETSITTAMTFLILIGSQIFGYFLAITRLPFELSSFVAALSVSRYVILIMILLIYLFLGAIMSSLAMIVLTVPIFFPVITALGFDPIWFGIVIVRLVEIGQITPPVGINVFVMQGIAKDIPMYAIFRGILPFLIADILHVTMLICIPQVALFLPSLMK